MSIRSIPYFIVFLLPPIIAFITGVLKYKQIKSQYLLLFVFVVFGCFTDCVTWLVIRLFNVQTIPAAHVYLVIEFLLLSLFYFKKLEGYINKTFFWVVFLLYELYIVINALFIQGIHVYPNFVRATGAIIMLVFAFMYFAKVMTESKIIKLSAEPMIWINVAFIVYFAANFFYNVIFNVLLEQSRATLRQFADYAAFFNLIMYYMVAVGFWKTKSETKSSV